MRRMIIVKATEKLIAETAKYDEELQTADVLLDASSLQPRRTP